VEHGLVSIIHKPKIPMSLSRFITACNTVVLLLLAACNNSSILPSKSSGGSYVMSPTTSGGGTPSGTGVGTGQPGVVTAGEWSDKLHWDFWVSLLGEEEFSGYSKTWGFNPIKRLLFTVRDSQAKTVNDAQIEVRDQDNQTLWISRTDNVGTTVLWPSLFSETKSPQQVIVRYQGQEFSFPNFTFSASNEITLPVSRTTLYNSDIAFVVDATGSMGDEMEYFKTELYDVLQRASQSNCAQWKLGSVFYRDAGDDYLTRVSDFTPNANTTIDFMKQQTADGGGDWPEAVHAGLHDALNSLSWSEGARARLLFLVLDAPPHDDEQIKEQVREEIRLAAEKGIRIIPVAASGIDKSTEFLLRSFSLATDGTYVFITDDSGVGDSHLKPTVGEYPVEKLNDLLVRLIFQYTSCVNDNK
jgi:hypothetical protein